MSNKKILELSDELNQEEYIELIALDSSFFAKIPVELRNNKEFVLKAIDAISYDREFYLRSISENLRDDKDVALKMVTKNFMCMEYLSARLLKDKEIAIVCLKHENSDTSYIHFDLVDELKANGIKDRLSAIKYFEAGLLKEELNDELSQQELKVKKPKL
jgi:hypothetical protein